MSRWFFRIRLRTDVGIELVAILVFQMMELLVTTLSNVAYRGLTSVKPWTMCRAPRDDCMLTSRLPNSSSGVMLRMGPTAAKRLPMVATRWLSEIRSRFSGGEFTKLRTWYSEKNVRRIPSSVK